MTAFHCKNFISTTTKSFPQFQVQLVNSGQSNLSLALSHTHDDRNLQELSLRKCPQLKQLPTTAQDLTSLRELDLRAPKKQVTLSVIYSYSLICHHRFVELHLRFMKYSERIIV